MFAPRKLGREKLDKTTSQNAPSSTLFRTLVVWYGDLPKIPETLRGFP